MEKGFFAQEGLEVGFLRFSTGLEALDAVLVGRADYATAAETPIAEAIDRGDNPQIVGTICTSDSYHHVVARKDRGIAGIEDLRARRVGVSTGTTADFFLYSLLVTSHVRPDEVQRIDLSPSQLVDALTRGDVDAVSAWVPFTRAAMDALGENARVLDPARVYTFTWNLVGTHMAERPAEVLQRLFRAVIAADRFIVEHPDEALAITARAIGVGTAELRKDWGTFGFKVALDQGLVLSLENQRRWAARRTGQAGPQQNVLRNIDAAGLNAVKPEAVRLPGAEG